MRLLETSSSDVPRVREFIGSGLPPYILSHTWEYDEVTLQQLTAGAAEPSTLEAKAGFHKIKTTCALARTVAGLEYTWVDTCCIDKTSSAELAEAINSMFAWYRDATPGTDEDLERDLPACRWFTRGWTLQELIAPRDVVFFDNGWNRRGAKKELAGLLSSITGIPRELLCHEAELCDFAVARRMSWAARRKTTRLEDTAYCLLGIFDVNLSLIYGEGTKAFTRLQTTIVQTTPDLSIFAWTDKRVPCPLFAGVLAESPYQFADCGRIELTLGDSAYADFAITTRGIQTEANLITIPVGCGQPFSLLLDTLCHAGGNMMGVHLRKIGGGLYARYKPDVHVMYTQGVSERPGLDRLFVETLTLATRLPPRFPFQQGLNPVLGNRCSALRLDLRGPVDGQCTWLPRSHWDPHDGVLTSTTLVPITLFLASSLDQIDIAAVLFLQSQLDHTKFESCRRAESLVRGIFDGKFIEQSTSTDSGPVTYCGDLQGPFQPANVTIDLRKEVRANICANPITVLDVSFDLLRIGEVIRQSGRQ
ncbi:vegetative incompatibility protein HET-E-1 [Chaetomidium leptoderma]|uniref:Vegetative incompatibility protein HET-E-1 n=1 Tax=Chaetomidium leptoderma TaxID=669021 RepID=A0AAN6VE89_9PEZI|nr:vegetative incompatibility protein HET-E-1 [Chaetomidium leptoderma]